MKKEQGKKSLKPKKLEVITDEEFSRMFDEMVQCHICSYSDYRYLETIDFIKRPGNKEYYLITYSCGHQRAHELLKYGK